MFKRTKPVKQTILKKQMTIYMSIILVLFGVFGSGISFIYTRHYMYEQEQQLIVQGERFKESLSNYTTAEILILPALILSLKL